jgi:protein transport protein SEC31
MHPLFTNVEPTQVPPQNTMDPMMNQRTYGQPQMNAGNQSYYQPQPAQDTNIVSNNHINYSNFSQFPVAQSGSTSTNYSIAEPVQPAKEIPREKPPLPEEFIHFQTVFDELKNQCIARANNPVRHFKIYKEISIFWFIFKQTKRKLDDVSKRLESLYDLLREQRVI